MRRKGMVRVDALRLSSYRCDTGAWHVGPRATAGAAERQRSTPTVPGGHMTPPEPPVGATITDRSGHVWHRTSTSWWCACGDWDYSWSWPEVWADADKPIEIKLATPGAS